jgi:hypothetical protein
LEFFRSLGGLVAIVGTTLPFRGPSRIIGDYIFHVVEALVLGVISLFVCSVVAVTIARSRGRLIARIWRPLLKIALTFGSLLAGDALSHVPTVTHLLNMKHPTLKGAFVVSISGWLVLLVFWLFMFGLWAFCYSARYFYCAGEMHPALAPLVAIVAVTMIAVLDIGRARGWFGGLETLFGKVAGRPGKTFIFVAPGPSRTHPDAYCWWLALDNDPGRIGMARHSDGGNLPSRSSVGQSLQGPAMSLSALRPPRLHTRPA